MRYFILSFTLFIGLYANAQKRNFSRSILNGNYSFTEAFAMNMGADQMLWITDRVGKKIFRVDPSTGEEDLLREMDEVSTTEEQAGLLGFTFHPEFGQGTGNNDVYISYTYNEGGENKQKIACFAYSSEDGDGTLTHNTDIITGMPASVQHNSGRLITGPDNKLYYTIGDQGNNGFGERCAANLAQVLPTQTEIDNNNYRTYEGKILRMNLDGSIPEDNPELDGVKSHIYTYGHRNAQGLVFGMNGKLYSSEHGPDTDDEINLIQSGSNYGWPDVAGYQDGKVYEYCNWSVVTNCASTSECPEAAISKESNFSGDNTAPMKTLFTVDNDFQFPDDWVLNPTIAPSSIDIYENDSIPGWKNTLLVPSLKRGYVMQLQLSENRNEITGDTTVLWNTQNRYRDIAVDPGGKKIYLVTDARGAALSGDGMSTYNLKNPSKIMVLEYQSSQDTNAITASSQAKKLINNIKISPNPVSDMLKVEFEKFNDSDIRLQMHDIAGNNVLSQQASKVSDKVRVNVSHLSSGVYFLTVNIHGQKVVKKVLIR